MRDAIAVMTAWADVDSGQNELLSATVLSIARERFPDDPASGFLHVAIGLGNLCGLLLVRRESERGVPIAETLQDLGQRFA